MIQINSVFNSCCKADKNQEQLDNKVFVFDNTANNMVVQNQISINFRLASESKICTDKTERLTYNNTLDTKESKHS